MQSAGDTIKPTSRAECLYNISNQSTRITNKRTNLKCHKLHEVSARPPNPVQSQSLKVLNSGLETRLKVKFYPLC